MPNEQLDDLYKQIKLTGTKAEALIIDWIRNRRNKKKIARLLGRRKTKWYDKILNNLQETTSIPLNLPIKRDVTDVTKLTLQNEQQLEDIRQKLDRIEDSLQRIEKAIKSNPKALKGSSKNRNTQPLSREEKARLVQENLEKLSKALLDQTKIGE